MGITGTLKITGSGYPFMFGRAMYNGYYQVGKVFAGPGFYVLEIQGEYGSVEFEDSFEVLACKDSGSSIPTRTTINYENSDSFRTKPCGSSLLFVWML